ncbi:RHS repeat-associated core domain-containing protein [Marinobacterium iners DSM 11526]|uniref:RHS repeat-associated core domain-containing protein n=1 Tax=Marinobacterium iners DSM 11526 TaxID=1122198 RepID=A0A1H4HAG5_9GAMM|nr:RHS repeat-associated core domain-containing protein [Marinobacterium iners DSM 11526]
MGTQPLAVIHSGPASAVVYYIHTDHLNTPQVVSDNQGTVVWRADYDAFGKASVASGSILTFNLRFPGQYFDSETGLHYNYYRDYDPSTGRYVQSDPIGLNGGINTYGYVGGNPLIYTDPYGLEAMSAGAAWGLRGLDGVSLFVPVPGARVFGVGLIAMTIPGDTPQDMQMDGLADGPAPYDHFEEDEALYFTPDPFGGGDACERLRHAIRVLRAQIAWRNTDLNPASASYQGHATRIALLTAALSRLEEFYRNICGGDCPA